MRVCCQAPSTSGGGSGVLEQPTTAERVVIDKAEYRRNVGICVINSEGKVFSARCAMSGVGDDHHHQGVLYTLFCTLRRVDDKHNTWQMPQGGIDPLENPMVAALRELREETGMRSVVLLGAIDGWLDYDFPTEVRSQMSGTWLRFRGQTQKWCVHVCVELCSIKQGNDSVMCCTFLPLRRFLAHFFGDESEIDLSHGGKPEFTEYTWLPMEQLPHEVVHFKQDVYAQVAKEFKPRIDRWLQEQQQRRLNKQ